MSTIIFQFEIKSGRLTITGHYLRSLAENTTVSLCAGADHLRPFTRANPLDPEPPDPVRKTNSSQSNQSQHIGTNWSGQRMGPGLRVRRRRYDGRGMKV